MKAIDEIFNKHAKMFTLNGDIISGELFLNRAEFEKAVKEILKLQREECERAYCHRPKWDHDIAVAILNAEVE